MVRFFPARSIFLSCLCLTLFGAWPQAGFAGTAIPKVLVSAAPLKPIVDALLSGITESSVLTRQGQDAHTMMMSFSQAHAIDGADIIIVPDRAMNPLVEQLANKRSKPPVIIALTELQGADALEYPTEQAWLRGSDIEKDDAEKDSDKEDDDTKKPDGEADKNQTLKDPHLWLDPERVAAIAPALAKAIGAYAPSHAAEMALNAKQLALHLRQEVQPNIAAMLKQRLPTNHMYARPYIPFITDHSAYQYFLARFAIQNPGALHNVPEEITGAATNLAALKRSEQVNIGCIMAEQETPVVSRVAKSTGARIVKLSPEALVDRESIPPQPWMKNDYDRLLYAVAKNFAGCL